MPFWSVKVSSSADWKPLEILTVALAMFALSTSETVRPESTAVDRSPSVYGVEPGVVVTTGGLATGLPFTARRSVLLAGGPSLTLKERGGGAPDGSSPVLR